MLPLGLFEGFGIELEYMIVDRTTLDVRAITDQVMLAATGEYASEVDMGAIGWSNELALHVIEFKTNGPVASLAGVDADFHANVRRVNEQLAAWDACLMPTGMHPWMDPLRETRLWPHDYNPVYEAFDRIFNCRGHGWSNLQSMHINLPFRDDTEFGRLHAAVRLVLPLLPGLAASTPAVDGRITGIADSRLDVYRNNCARVPSVTGRVVPEAVFSRADYEREVLGRMYEEIAPLDPDGVLRDEWLNARGAIARFDRNAIEIRVLDVQECPTADLAVARFVTAVVRALVEERWRSYATQKEWQVSPLEAVFLESVKAGEQAGIVDAAYLEMFGMRTERATVGEVWRHLYDELRAEMQLDGAAARAIETILEEGTLSTRLARRLGPAPTRTALQAAWFALCTCLADNRMFGARAAI